MSQRGTDPDPVRQDLDAAERGGSRPWASRRTVAAGCGVLLVVIFVIDLLTQDLPMLPYLCVPVVLAAGVSGRRDTSLLAAMSVTFAIVDITTGYAVADPQMWAYVSANVLVCAAAIWFAGRRAATERAATAAAEDFRLALQSTPVASALVDLTGTISAVNPAMVALTGREADWLHGRPLSDLLVEHSEQDRARLRRDLLDDPAGGSRVLEHRMSLADGREARVREHVAVMADLGGSPRGFIVQYEDTTAEYATRRALEHKAHHDPLTGLLNRRGLLARLGPQVTARRKADAWAVLFVDLDGLKPVNDSLGHGVGDALIRAVAERIAGSVRADDLVARVGGDEFVVALPHLGDLATATELAEKVRSAIHAPLDVEDHALRPAASIGVATATDDTSTADLLDRADRAQYRAKRAGGNRVAAFDPDLDGALDDAPGTGDQSRS